MRAFGRSGDLRDALQTFSRAEVERLLAYWPLICRPDQSPERVARDGGPWTTWLVLGGRGSGKTRTGAEWVKGLALGLPDFCQTPARRIALVGETFAAVRDVMVEGPSGILAVHAAGERPAWLPSLRRLVWPNGVLAHAFSAEDPDSLRGPQFEAAWCDELAKWRHPEQTWDMLQFGLRLGSRPRQVVTTTPKPIPLLKRLLAEPGVAVSRARTSDNAENLAPAFLETVVGRYAGTRLGRQELEGEIVEDRPDALWTRDGLELLRATTAPASLARIVVAVDPPASSGPRADACGIVAAGLAADGVAYVLADATLRTAKPRDWAGRAVALFRRLEADALVVETNQGGEMVAAVLHEVDPGVPVTAVRATRGKYLRAEPVSLLYAQGRVRHVGGFPELEDELCDFGPGGLGAGGSPDRLDALVWALTHLMLGPRAEPRIRTL